MRFTITRDYDYEYRLQSIEPMTDSDWPVWFIIRLTDMWEATGETDQAKYAIEVHAIAPQAVSAEDRQRAIESCGCNVEDPTDELLADILCDYGISAPIWQSSGNNRNTLLRAARKEMLPICCMFGFYMDRPLNRIGNTGWDWIKGEIGFKPSAAE